MRKKNPIAKLLKKSLYKLRIFKKKKGKGSYVRSNFSYKNNSD
tara:strand:+ start:2346 stop:2474 length:129 start_codon:yes stop_codon:yes gene_type:complete